MENNTKQVPFVRKMFNLRSEIDGISKGRANDYHGSVYFDINDTLKMLNPLLLKHELLLTQPIKGNRVYTIIKDINLNEDGEHDQEESFLELPTDLNPQKIGSAITYYRRYTLVSLLGLQAEDDDGNTAIPTGQQKQKRQPVQKPANNTPNIPNHKQQKQQIKPVKPIANKKAPTEWLDLIDPKTNTYTDAYHSLVLTMTDNPNKVSYESVLSKWKVNTRDKQILMGLFHPEQTQKK